MLDGRVPPLGSPVTRGGGFVAVRLIVGWQREGGDDFIPVSVMSMSPPRVFARSVRSRRSLGVPAQGPCRGRRGRHRGPDRVTAGECVVDLTIVVDSCSAFANEACSTPDASGTRGVALTAEGRAPASPPPPGATLAEDGRG